MSWLASISPRRASRTPGHASVRVAKTIAMEDWRTSPSPSGSAPSAPKSVFKSTMDNKHVPYLEQMSFYRTIQVRCWFQLVHLLLYQLAYWTTKRVEPVRETGEIKQICSVLYYFLIHFPTETNPTLLPIWGGTGGIFDIAHHVHMKLILFPIKLSYRNKSYTVIKIINLGRDRGNPIKLSYRNKS